MMITDYNRVRKLGANQVREHGVPHYVVSLKVGLGQAGGIL